MQANESMPTDEAVDQRVVRNRGELEICTNIKFDFQKRIWTDHSVSDFIAFKERWETKKGFRKYFLFSNDFYRKSLEDWPILEEL